MMRIETKQQMYELYVKGAFGNHVLTVRTPEEARSFPQVLVWCIRGMKTGGSYMNPNVLPPDLEAAASVARRVCGDNWVFSEMVQGKSIILQGELALLPERGWWLRYTKENVLLKHLNEVEHHDVSGVAALAVVRAYSDSANHLTNLCRCYGGQTDPCVVEFSVMQERCGIENKRTLIWEVRNGY